MSLSHTGVETGVVIGKQSKGKDMELKGHTDSVDQLCWDPKHADLLATASGDKTVRLWDARSEYLSMYSPFFTSYICISSPLSLFLLDLTENVINWRASLHLKLCPELAVTDSNTGWNLVTSNELPGLCSSFS